MENTELPLVIYHKNAEHQLEVYKPRDGEALDPAHHHLITVQEDLEKLPKPILARLYNQANPGLNVTSFKPGTEIRFCLPSLLKLAANPVAATTKDPNKKQEAAVNKDETKKEEAAVPKAKRVKKSEIIYKYKKGPNPCNSREGSLRKIAYDLALTDPSKMTPKHRVIANAQVRSGLLEYEV